MTLIDSVYERNDHRLTFFVGNKYYTLNARTLRVEPGYPRPLTHLGLPTSLRKVTDVYVESSLVGRAYLFNGTFAYWHLNEVVDYVELGYPLSALGKNWYSSLARDIVRFDE